MDNEFVLGINIAPLLKAYRTFDTYRLHIIDEQDRAGAIQAFEFSFELAWKTIKRVLEKKGLQVRSPRDAFREAANNGLIQEPKVWFLFIDKRNLTAHTYQEATAEEIVKIFESFSQELKLLIENIQAMNE
jgi:nucleotidyltransferase substrate binding protein (TIGR01987 family)